MTTTTKPAIEAIKNAPRCPRGVLWSAKPEVMGVVACAILGARDMDKAISEITDATGVQLWTLRHFIRGNDASGNRSQAIHDATNGANLPLLCNRRGQRRTALQIAAAPGVAGAEQAPQTKPVTLATTNKGEVIVADVPPQVATPTAMAAKPGEFATKENSTRCVLDTKTRDILVITTKRIPFGTPEWCDKMVDINSKPRA